MTIKFRDFINFSDLFYKSIGFQPFQYIDGELQPRPLPDKLIFYLIIGYMDIQLFAQIVYTVSALNSKNYVDATMAMSYIGFICVSTYKMVAVSFRKETLMRFMLDLQELFPVTKQQQDEYQLRRYERKCKRITRSYSLLYMLLICTYNLYPIMQYLIYDYWLELREVGKKLPYFLYIPWDWQEHWSYWPLYVLEMIGAYASIACQVGSDLLLTASARQVIMHFDYVAREIESYSPGLSQRDFIFIQRIISYHDKIFRLSDEMNNIFGVPILLNFITSAFIICFVGFQMTIGVTVDFFLKLLLFLLSSLAQVYLICYSAQELITASENVALAVYRQYWFSGKTWYQKMLLLIAARSQKAAGLKATSFITVSPATMTELLKISYKFFALIRTVYQN